MAKNLSTLYPGKITVDADNPNGTFKNRTSDALKDGTPYEYGWASDVWGFLSHILGLASVVPNGAEENETNSQYYDALEGLVGRRAVEFETSRDLVMNYTSNTTAQATFSRMSLLNSNYVPKYLINKTLNWEMPTDLEAGTSEKASTTYGCWVDSDSTVKLVPDIEGTCDSTVSGFLVDSTATLLTDLIHDGDILYNLTTKVKTTASADAAAQDRVAATDNIFSSGDEYKIVKMSPVGLGAWRERLGSVYNGSGSNFEDQWYTQIQEEKFYSESAGDLAVTGTNWATIKAIASIRQINDWTGKGLWKIDFNVVGSVPSLSRNTFLATMTGIVTDDTANNFQAISATDDAAAGSLNAQLATVGAGGFSISHATIATTRYGYSGSIILKQKPTFHN